MADFEDFEEEQEDFDIQVKMLMIGDSGVGKTCLLLRYARDAFATTFITTVGIDFKTKFIDIKGQKVKLQIWDTAGQERFRTITTSYFRGAQGILLCYDVTDRKTFENVNVWMQQIAEHADDNVCKILIGNKMDREAERRVTTQEGMEMAERHGIPFVETSAKINHNVADGFETIGHRIVDKYSKEEAAHTQNVDITEKTDTKGGCCKK